MSFWVRRISTAHFTRETQVHVTTNFLDALNAYTFLLYKKNLYKKMSLKNPEILRKC